MIHLDSEEKGGTGKISNPQYIKRGCKRSNRVEVMPLVDGEPMRSRSTGQCRSHAYADRVRHWVHKGMLLFTVMTAELAAWYGLRQLDKKCHGTTGGTSFVPAHQPAC